MNHQHFQRSTNNAYKKILLIVMMQAMNIFIHFFIFAFFVIELK